MNASEYLKRPISTLSEEQLDKNEEVIVDEFYQQMIDDIKEDNEPGVSASQLYSELDIVR